jgi:homocysteine S-methyltransferase
VYCSLHYIPSYLRAVSQIASGESLAETVALIESIAGPQVAAVGVNCCPPSIVSGAIDCMAAVPSVTSVAGSGSRRRIVVYPNSGEVYDIATQSWIAPTSAPGDGDGGAGSASGSREEDVAAFVRMCEDWVRRGASGVGGCCRVSPRHICALAAAMSSP